MNVEPFKNKSMKRIFFFFRQLLAQRSVLIFFLTGGICLQARAQFLGGFSSQQSRKEKLMVEQIAGYRLYLSELRGGIHIVETGLQSAHDLKRGTLDLHAAYFSSLQQVSPGVRNNPKAKAMPGIEQHIAGAFDQELAFQQKANVLTHSEQDYIRQVYQNLLAKCHEDLSALHDVLTPEKLELNDAQRLERIDQLYEAMQDKLSFTGSFTSKCHGLALWRQQTAKDRQTLRKLYGGQ
jgi:hypothetical protein